MVDIHKDNWTKEQMESHPNCILIEMSRATHGELYKFRHYEGNPPSAGFSKPIGLELTHADALAEGVKITEAENFDAVFFRSAPADKTS